LSALAAFIDIGHVTIIAAAPMGTFKKKIDRRPIASISHPSSSTRRPPATC